jgi:hypothetical protein
MLSTSISESSNSISSRDIDEETKNLFKNCLSKDELEEAIEKCKTLILDAEEMSFTRRWLIRKLIDLRFRLAHINALREDVKSDDDTSIAGHNFKVLKHIPSKRMFCDFCTNIIWIFQGCYSCADCCYSVHSRCLKYVTRTCAHIVVCEKGRPEYRICPEIGLSMQVRESKLFVLKLE